MKKNKNLFVCLMLAGILLVSVLIGTVAARRQETPASKELTVVTSFYPMYKVGTVSLSPRGDWRMPSDAKNPY